MRKIICVEGISGSGKSNLCQYLSLQYSKSGIRNRWYSEFDSDNPIIIPNDHNHIIKEAKLSWNAFIGRNDQISIIDGRLFYLNVEFSLKAGKSKKEIINDMLFFINNIDVNNNFILFQLNTNSMDKLYNNTSNCRKADDWYINGIDTNIIREPVSGNGVDKVISFHNIVNEIMLELFKTIKCEKHLIDITNHDWTLRQNQCLKKLNLKKYQFNANVDLMKYAGKYTSQDAEYLLKYDKNELLIVKHPYLKYSPVEQIWRVFQYDIETLIPMGQPIVLKFKQNEKNEIIEMSESGFFIDRAFHGQNATTYYKV